MSGELHRGLVDWAESNLRLARTKTNLIELQVRRNAGSRWSDEEWYTFSEIDLSEGIENKTSDTTSD